MRNLCPAVEDDDLRGVLKREAGEQFASGGRVTERALTAAVAKVMAVRETIRQAVNDGWLPWIVCIHGGGITDEAAAKGLDEIQGAAVPQGLRGRIRGIELSRIPEEAELVALKAMIVGLNAPDPERLAAARLILDGICALEQGLPESAARGRSLVQVFVGLVGGIGALTHDESCFSSVVECALELAGGAAEFPIEKFLEDQRLIGYRALRRAVWAAAGLSWTK